MKAQKKIASAQDFAQALAALQERFAALKPEVEETVRDPALGIEGYIVVWNTGISVGGPVERSGKGGTRITPDVTLDDVRMLARTMALKNAAAGLPMGGAKSALRADPTAPDFEKKYRRFVQLCKPFLLENGGRYGGFGFDIGGRPEHALWACDELKSTRCFTGKPLAMGGTDYDREGIAGLGVAVAGQTLMQERGRDPARATFAIQGMGAMGAAVFRYFRETGARLAALGDPKYGGTWIFDKAPGEELAQAIIKQDVEAVKAGLAREAKNIAPGAEDVLYQECDILFPCAIQNVVTAANVARLRARFVSEGANGPLDDAARLALHVRGVPVVADFIANPGGIIAAFVEMTSSSTQKAEEAKALTRAKITENVKEMNRLAQEYNVPLHQAGLYMALDRIFS